MYIYTHDDLVHLGGLPTLGDELHKHFVKSESEEKPVSQAYRININMLCHCS